MAAASQEPSSSDILESYARVCDNRAWTYGFISRLFKREIDQEFIDAVQGVRLPAASGNENIDEGYRLIATQLGCIQDDTLLKLAVDYAHTFIGAGRDGHSAAYPYESVYTSEHGLLMQEARDEVRAIYRAAGLAKQGSWKETEDHLATELEYMQILCRRCADALRRGDEATASGIFESQYNFLEDHLVSWVPRLVADMRKFARTDFYQGLALLVAGFLQVDEGFLYDLVDDGDKGEDEVVA